MGRKNGKMAEALTAVLQTQAIMQQNISALQQNISALQQSQIAFTAQMAEMRAEADRRWAHTLERFSRIEAILLEHSRTLQNLPEAVREKIGFRVPAQPTPS